MSPYLSSARWLMPVALATLLLTGVAPASTADDGAMCGDEPATIIGTPGDDVLLGTRGNDVIAGLGGDDVIRGRAGDDVICGGPGDDLLAGGAGTDVLRGDAGTDTATYVGAPAAVQVDLAGGSAEGGFGVDRIAEVENVTGSFWGDTLLGDAGPNLLLGGPGADLLAGQGGDDVLLGGRGLDTATYAASSGAVMVALRQGRAAGGAGADRLATIEHLVGSPYDDFLEGNARDNRLVGGGGDDVLRGYSGSDLLIGGAGLDVTIGGPGIDACDGEASPACDPDDPGDTKNCSDFLTQPHAQAWFEAFFPTYGDVARLDADANGQACETLDG